MDEKEWLACEDPVAVLLLLWDGNRGSERKFLLFAVGCWRLARPSDERGRKGAELLERFAEGLATAEEFASVLGWRRTTRAYEFLEEALIRRAERDAGVDEQLLTTVFCCVFGDPRRPLPSIPRSALAWNDACVVKLAKAMYEQRRFEGMPLLADALEDAGCMDADVLGHCREPGGVHVRGCWVIDLLLGKE